MRLCSPAGKQEPAGSRIVMETIHARNLRFPHHARPADSREDDRSDGWRSTDSLPCLTRALFSMRDQRSRLERLPWELDGRVEAIGSTWKDLKRRLTSSGAGANNLSRFTCQTRIGMANLDVSDDYCPFERFDGCSGSYGVGQDTESGWTYRLRIRLKKSLCPILPPAKASMVRFLCSVKRGNVSISLGI